MRSTFFLLFLALLPFSGAAQFNLDSLMKELETAPPDSNRTKTLQNVARVYMGMGKFKDARAYFGKTMELAKQLGDRKRENSTFINIGISYYYESDLVNARSNWDKALAMAQERKDSVLITSAINNLGNVELNTGNYEAAQQAYLDVLRWAEAHQDSGKVVECLTNLASVFGYQNKSVTTKHRVLKLNPESINFLRKLIG